jgi:TRAP-type C4-dicarboxylate transport system permease small subunit
VTSRFHDAGILARRTYLLVGSGILAVAMVILLGAILIQNLTRLMQYPGFSWTTEIIQGSLVWITGTGLGAIAAQRKLLNIELLPQVWTAKIQAWLLPPAGGMLIFCALVLSIRTWSQTTPVLGLPMGLHVTSMIWGGLGLVLSAIADLRNPTDPGHNP